MTCFISSRQSLENSRKWDWLHLLVELLGIVSAKLELSKCWRRVRAGYTDKCLRHVGRVSVSRGHQTCRNLNAHVPGPRSYRENNDYNNAFRNEYGLYSNYVQLNFQQKSEYGRLTWKTPHNSRISWFNWGPGSASSSRNYLVMTTGDGKWQSVSSYTRAELVCETDAKSGHSGHGYHKYHWTVSDSVSPL